MPRKTAAKKALRVTARQTERNRAAKARLRDAVRAVRKAVATGKSDDARKALVKATSQIDRAVKQKLVHRNKAARLTGRLTQAVNKLETPKKA